MTDRLRRVALVVIALCVLTSAAEAHTPSPSFAVRIEGRGPAIMQNRTDAAFDPHHHRSAVPTVIDRHHRRSGMPAQAGRTLLGSPHPRAQLSCEGDQHRPLKRKCHDGAGRVRTIAWIASAR